MTDMQFLGISGISMFFVTICGFILKTILVNRIEHEYNKRLDEFKAEIKRRESAEMVADLFSKWLWPITQKSQTLSTSELRELNRLSFMAVLWLPDDVSIKIGELLCGKRPVGDFKNVLIECRKLIRHDHKTELKDGDITVF